VERSGLPNRAGALPRTIIFAFSLIPTVVFLYVALRRIGYPYELEWLEGGAVEIVRRVADGHSIYVQPSLRYVPYPYTPLYFWVCGLVSHFTGVGFFPLRLVSLVSSLGCCVMLIAIVRRETADIVSGVLASGLFMATFAVSGAWLDIGRVDSFALLLVLVAFYVARRVEGLGGGVLLGTLVFLAFMAKQSDLIAAAPVLLLLLVLRRRVGVAALLSTTALMVASTLILNATTHGWYGYYVFDELLRQGVISSVWRTFFTKDLWHVPWVLALVIAGMVVNFRFRNRDKPLDWLFWPAATSGLIISALVSRLHSGGGEDVLIPAYAGLALLGASGCHAVWVRTQQPPSRITHRRSARSPAIIGAVLTTVVGIQIAALHYSPARYVPTSADQTAGRYFIDLVRRTPGPVIVSNHPYYETLADKASWAQGEAVHDVLRAGSGPARRDLMASIHQFLTASTPATIFSDDPHYALGAYSDAYFRLTGARPFACERCFYPVTDTKRRPSYRFVRR
jgi:hypothetical protein